MPRHLSSPRVYALTLFMLAPFTLMPDRDTQRSRSIQVGILMKAYREAFSTENGDRGLTQEELLRRMAAVDDQYVDHSSHTMVSRWESGATRPNRQRIEVFGKALDLSEAEVDGLMTLAGFKTGAVARLDQAEESSASDAATSASPDAAPASPTVEPYPHVSVFAALGIHEALRFSAWSCLLPGLVIFASGYLLMAAGLMDPWLPIVYVVSIMSLMLAYKFVRMRGPNALGEFLSISVFFLLSTQLLQSSLTRMDNYGFYALGEFAVKPFPYMLALLVNLLISSTAALVFHLLWNWQYGSGRGADDPLRRAITVVAPPAALAYLCILVLSNIAVWIQFGMQLAAFSGVFVILILLRDPAVDPSERDRRFFLYATLATTITMATVGAATMLAVFLSPGLPSVFPDHNLLFSWDIDFHALGYPPEEAMERLNVGYLWQSMCTYVYMVFVVGGSLIVAMFRLNSRAEPSIDPDALGSPRETMAGQP